MMTEEKLVELLEDLETKKVILDIIIEAFEEWGEILGLDKETTTFDEMLEIVTEILRESQYDEDTNEMAPASYAED